MDRQQLQRKGGLISLLIGGPVGLFVLGLSILIPSMITGEGLFLMAFFPMNKFPILGLVISFFIMLWIAGKQATDNLLNNHSLFWTSTKYSLTINAVIWSVFIITFAIVNRQDYEWFYGLFVPIIFALISVAFTPFTVGLIVCYVIKRRVISQREAYEIQ